MKNLYYFLFLFVLKLCYSKNQITDINPLKKLKFLENFQSLSINLELINFLERKI